MEVVLEPHNGTKLDQLLVEDDSIKWYRMVKVWRMELFDHFAIQGIQSIRGQLRISKFCILNLSLFVVVHVLAA